MFVVNITKANILICLFLLLFKYIDEFAIVGIKFVYISAFSIYIDICINKSACLRYIFRKHSENYYISDFLLI